MNLTFRFIKEHIESGPTFQYARNNIARLHIYYDDIKQTNVDQEKAYEIQVGLNKITFCVKCAPSQSYYDVFELPIYDKFLTYEF